MIPVYQTNFDVPGGNCFSACVASILELPLEQVPYFMENDHSWWQKFNKWLKLRNMYGVYLLEEWSVEIPAGIHIASGIVEVETAGLCNHAVVARGKKVIHDPHPEGGGVDEIEHRVVLVPMNPA
jgi:hypothetical protein